MKDLSLAISIITLHVNGLNMAIKDYTIWSQLYGDYKKCTSNTKIQGG